MYKLLCLKRNSIYEKIPENFKKLMEICIMKTTHGFANIATDAFLKMNFLKYPWANTGFFFITKLMS